MKCMNLSSYVTGFIAIRMRNEPTSKTHPKNRYWVASESSYQQQFEEVMYEGLNDIILLYLRTNFLFG